MSTEQITLTEEGARIYIGGNTFPIKSAIKESGGHWDSDRKQWWIGKAKRAAIQDAIAKACAEAPEPMKAGTSKTMVAIGGNTYPVRAKLAELGGKWNGEVKTWEVPSDVAKQAQELVAGAPKSEFRHTRCKSCGCAPSQYNPIYRSGLCRSCYQGEKEEREMGY